MKAEDNLRFDAEGVKRHYQELSRQRYIEEGRKAGIREVVEWLERARRIKVPKYQLKEWGIE